MLVFESREPPPMLPDGSLAVTPLRWPVEVGDGCTLRDDDRDGTGNSDWFFFDESVVAADDPSSSEVEFSSRWSGLRFCSTSVATYLLGQAYRRSGHNELWCARKGEWWYSRSEGVSVKVGTLPVFSSTVDE